MNEMERQVHGSSSLEFYGAPTRGKRHICPVCGTKFVAGTSWVYRTKAKVFCRWNCQVAWEKAHPSKPQRLRGAAAYGYYLTNTDVWKDSRRGCEARVRYCRTNLEKYRMKLMNGGTHHGPRLQGVILRWQAKLDDALTQLARMEAAENGAE